MKLFLKNTDINTKLLTIWILNKLYKTNLRCNQARVIFKDIKLDKVDYENMIIELRHYHKVNQDRFYDTVLKKKRFYKCNEIYAILRKLDKINNKIIDAAYSYDDEEILMQTFGMRYTNVSQNTKEKSCEDIIKEYEKANFNNNWNTLKRLTNLGEIRL